MHVEKQCQKLSKATLYQNANVRTSFFFPLTLAKIMKIENNILAIGGCSSQTAAFIFTCYKAKVDVQTDKRPYLLIILMLRYCSVFICKHLLSLSVRGLFHSVVFHSNCLEIKQAIYVCIFKVKY